MSCISLKSSKNNSSQGKPVNFYLLSQRFRFSQQELLQHHQRFTNLSRNGLLTLDSFREHMGFLGLSSTRVISDRIFYVMDKSKSGSVSFEEFLEYMDIVTHGSHEEKALSAFKLIAQGSATITLEEFSNWLFSIWKMYNVLTGSSLVADREDIQRYFNTIDLKLDGVIDFEEYKESMLSNGQALDWFYRLSDGIATGFQPAHKTPKPQIDTIEEGLNECLRLLTNTYSPVKAKDPIRIYTSGELEEPSDSEDSMCITEDSSDNLSYSTDSTVYSRVMENLQDLIEKVNQLKEEPRGRLLSAQCNVPKVNNPKKKSFIQWGDKDWNLVLNMMLGIQKSVKSSDALVGFGTSPCPSDFTEELKHKLPISSHSVKPSTLTDIAPGIFARLRRYFGVNSQDYIKSLGIEKVVKSLVQSDFTSLIGLVSSGKSGSFFYYSDDCLFVLKTLSRTESSFFKKVLPAYYEHIMNNPETLIPRIYGFHKISCVNSEKVKKYFIVMSNIFVSGHEIHLRYDLKGSVHGRRTNPLEDHSIARKDLDFMDSNMKIRLGTSKKQKLMRQLHRDCQFFVDNEIIDYSLLVGIHYPKTQSIFSSQGAFWNPDDGGIVSSDGKALYFCGVIDILTVYNKKKKLEHLFKGAVHGSRTISCIPPQAYAHRFLRYLDSVLE